MSAPGRLVLRTLLLAVLGVLALAGARLAAPVPAPARTIAGEREAAAALRVQVAAESRRIATTRAGVADAERRLAALQARVAARESELAQAQDRLVRARVRLTRLQRREARDQRILADNLAGSYRAGQPSYIGVVVSARGFTDLLERVAFVKRVSRRNATILDDTRTARAAVARQAGQLEGLRTRFSRLAKQAIVERNAAGVVRSALLRRQEQQLASRNGTAARLATVRGRIGRLERQQAIAVRQARAASTAASAAPRVALARRTSSPGGGGSPTPSGGGGGGGGSGAVARVVAAANQIATTPYVWGGGHGGASGGYDCSGSLSYALAAGGLLSSPLDSTGFMSWGDPGPGRRITVYANAGHAFMIVDGRRFDTSNISGGGTRWSSASRSTAGFTARHPPGL